MLDVIQKVDGNTVVVSSWGDDALASAKAAYHDRCKLLYADPDTTKGVVVLVDDRLDVVDGCKEFIEK